MIHDGIDRLGDHRPCRFLKRIRRNGREPCVRATLQPFRNRRHLFTDRRHVLAVADKLRHDRDLLAWAASRHGQDLLRRTGHVHRLRHGIDPVVDHVHVAARAPYRRTSYRRIPEGEESGLGNEAMIFLRDAAGKARPAIAAFPEPAVVGKNRIIVRHQPARVALPGGIPSESSVAHLPGNVAPRLGPVAKMLCGKRWKGRVTCLRLRQDAHARRMRPGGGDVRRDDRFHRLKELRVGDFRDRSRAGVGTRVELPIARRALVAAIGLPARVDEPDLVRKGHSGDKGVVVGRKRVIARLHPGECMGEAKIGQRLGRRVEFPHEHHHAVTRLRADAQREFP